jgi:predicted phage terminase large subunit-like protein
MIDDEILNRMCTERSLRIAITKENFFLFFHFYYAHYVKYKTANFQKQIMSYLQGSATENLYVVAFRGSGKSTIITAAYPIWAILGKQQKKFCVIFCQTKAQAKQHMMNIRTELESNETLKQDLGPFQEESDEWGSNSIVFKQHGARITVASTEQSIRGIRHNEHRPDLIICDDVEDYQSASTKEGREKTYRWLCGEVVPAGDRDTRLIIVGNLLHEDSLLMRIEKDLLDGRANGIFLRYPLINGEGVCTWLGKYENKEDLENEKLKVVNQVVWEREYMLRIIPNDGQVIHQEWIKYYDKLPDRDDVPFRGTFAGVDLAISKEESADYTAIVTARVYGRGEDLRIYIQPNPIMQKLTFPEQVELIKTIKKTQMPNLNDLMFVENVSYQAALPQQLEVEGVRVIPVKPCGDKRTRLALTSSAIASGKVLFDRRCEALINQLVGFDVENHDDLADAFSLLVNETLARYSGKGVMLMGFMDNHTGRITGNVYQG